HPYGRTRAPRRRRLLTEQRRLLARQALHPPKPSLGAADRGPRRPRCIGVDHAGGRERPAVLEALGRSDAAVGARGDEADAALARSPRSARGQARVPTALITPWRMRRG